MSSDFWGNCFYGSPQQNFGDVNAALFNGSMSELHWLLSARLASGDVVERCAVNTGDTVVSLLEFPSGGSARFGILFSGAPGARPTISAIYPVLEGLPNSLIILNHKAWDNKLLGMTACQTGDGGSIGFFDPFYFRDAEKLKRGTRKNFSLAAVAYSMAIAKNDEVEITEGPIYEANLAEFLAQHPGRKREEFPRLLVLLGSVQMFFPTDYTGDYHYRALVLAKQAVGLAGQKLLRFHLCINPDDESRSPELWLYASEHVIKGREPNTGDYIEGYCAAQGYPC